MENKKPEKKRNEEIKKMPQFLVIVNNLSSVMVAVREPSRDVAVATKVFLLTLMEREPPETHLSMDKGKVDLSESSRRDSV